MTPSNLATIRRLAEADPYWRGFLAGVENARRVLQRPDPSPYDRRDRYPDRIFPIPEGRGGYRHAPGVALTESEQRELIATAHTYVDEHWTDVDQEIGDADTRYGRTTGAWRTVN